MRIVAGLFGYYHSAATMVREEIDPEVPGLTRRVTLSSCHTEPVRAFTQSWPACPPPGYP
jgi:hypothetical protein